MERILVVKLYAIGDFVMSLPALGLLRSGCPDARIDLLTSGLLSPLARIWAPVDRVLTLDDRILDRRSRTPALAPLALGLRREGYDRGYLLHRILPLRLFLRLACRGSRIGQGTSSLGLTEVVPFETGVREHDAERYARLFGWEGEQELEMPCRETGLAGIRKLLPVWLRSGTVALAPGGGRSSIRSTDAKRWPPERFVEIARRLHSRSVPTVLLGSSQDGLFLRELRDSLKGETRDLIGSTDLLEAMAVLSGCSLLVTNDSSLMHLAGLAGTPTVTVFGPTDPARIGVFPPSGKHRQLLPEGFPCSPCHPPDEVDSCGDPRCIRSITVDRVWKDVEELLDLVHVNGES